MKCHIKIRTAQKTFCGAKFHWDSRLQSGDIRLGFNLWYIVQGKGRLETPEGPFSLSRGDCFLLRSRDEHLGTADSEDPVVVSWCCYDYFDAEGRRILPDEANLPPRHRVLSETDFFESIMERLIDSFQFDPFSEKPVQWLQAALNEVDRLDRRTRTIHGIALEQAETIDEICRSIRENPGRKFRLPHLAQKTSMCIDHFIRVFKRHKGMPPGEYIINCRINAARDLLQFSSHNISQISELLGYPDVFAFSRQFKKHTGKPPSRFRGH